MKDFFTTETTVKINVATIDGKKITKSIFNQINSKSPFNFDKEKGYIFEGEKILGYVFDKEYWLLWIEENKVFKTNLNRIFKIANLSSSSYFSSVTDLFNPLSYFGSEYLKENFKEFDDYYIAQQKNSDVLVDSALEKLKKYVLNAREWKTEILNHQIFL